MNKGDYKEKQMSQEQLVNTTVNDVIKEKPGAMSDLDNFVRLVGKKFIENKLLTFPNLCVETRRVNYIQRKELLSINNEKGWSDTKDFKMEYIIPKQLYNFMINMVHREFWKDENARVWRSFMKQLMRGDDPHWLLRKVKVHYLGGQREHG